MASPRINKRQRTAAGALDEAEGWFLEEFGWKKLPPLAPGAPAMWKDKTGEDMIQARAVELQKARWVQLTER